MTIKSKLAAIYAFAAVLALSAVFAFAVLGQRSRSGVERDPVRDATTDAATTADGQWEYLVVAGGNVNFSTSGNDPSFRKQTDAFRSEAYPLERNLDKLGAKGWELVAVHGTPMEPVFYLKRPKATR